MTEGVVIGLDTSCYTTSAAAVTVDGQVIASSRKLLPVPEGQRGLRQSEMVFIHTKQLPERMQEVAEAVKGHKVVAVCASRYPRDDENSYMPAFQVGDAQARSLAAVLGVPCFACSHQRGHIHAAMVDSGVNTQMPMLAVHLSGGTTEVLSYNGEQLKLLGGSLDLHAGQLVDRTGVALGLPFPAGPHLEALALQGKSEALLPTSMDPSGLWCHLSGAETQVQRWIAMGTMPRENIAMEVYDLLARTVARLVLQAGRTAGIRQVLIAGGVASSKLFRPLVTERIHKKDMGFHVCFGKPEYSGDNAVGVALIGAAAYRRSMNSLLSTADKL